MHKTIIFLLFANHIKNSELFMKISVLNKVKGIAFVKLDEKDIVRHRLVKDIIKAYKLKDSK